MTEPRWLDETEQRAWRSLMAMQEELVEFIDRQLRRRCGLSYTDYQVLALLSETSDGPLRSFQLGRLLHWEKSRLSQHLGRMEKRGLIARQRCHSDKRGSFVTITGHGRDMIEAAAPAHVADIREVVIDHLTAAELEALATIGDKVRERLARARDRDGRHASPATDQLSQGMGGE